MLMTGLLLLTCLSCKNTYEGDGVLTHNHAPFWLWPDVFEIQMPRIDISKPHIEKYRLRGIPVSKARYDVFLVIPTTNYLEPKDMTKWGDCSFEIRRNGVSIKRYVSAFCKMGNNKGQYNKLYIDLPLDVGADFHVSNDQDQWDVVFECSGVDSPEPVWAYILLHSGGK